MNWICIHPWRMWSVVCGLGVWRLKSGLKGLGVWDDVVCTQQDSDDIQYTGVKGSYNMVRALLCFAVVWFRSI